jgi:two-component system, response regulator PdtaR
MLFSMDNIRTMLSLDRAPSRRILLVDDDEPILDLLSHILQGAGYAIEKATSAEAAWAAIAGEEPDLAVLDVYMPGVSGLELAKQLRERSEVPFMFVSGSKERTLVREATDYGAVGYLVKPFDHAQIVPTVEAALARADEIRRLRRTEAHLNTALATGRETSMAVGLLMAKFQTTRDTAFEVLRDYARSHRRKINEVAQELLAAEERLAALKTMLSTERIKPPHDVKNST